MSDLVGKHIGSYQVLALIGSGGMGDVYRALDTKLKREVAIKALPDEFSRSSERVRRFQREAEVLASLNHPNIAAIYDLAEFDGSKFLVLELVGGESLVERLRRGPLPIREALAIAKQICDALEASHEKGVIHRDLKPANIMVTPNGRVKVLDFGIARIAPSSDGPTLVPTALETNEGVLIGTVAYMSPEQATGKPVDFRTDLWSLGIVLYEMVAGSSPFGHENVPAALHAIVTDTPVPLQRLRPDAPLELWRIVSRAMEKDPENRYGSASSMSQDVSQVLSDIVPVASHSRRGIRPFYLFAATLLLLAAVATAVWLYGRSQNQYWAHEKAIPEIRKLIAENRPLAAFVLAEKAEHYIPGDVTLAQTVAEFTVQSSIESIPPGAVVEIQDYLAPDDPWQTIGKTPLDKVRIPSGFFRWKVSKLGAGDVVRAQRATPSVSFEFDDAVKSPDGMVPVTGGPWIDFIGFLGWMGPYNVPKFYIDRYEVTNKQYQDFVDKGGYQKKEYWKERFVRDGYELSWDEAMALFRDTTGRPGPSTWEAGHYPEGKADYPVSGVSWFEAAAFEEFSGKSLPAIAQWYKTEPAGTDQYVARLSNFAKPAPVGQFKGMGPYGTYDMVGNVREWCLNNVGKDLRFIPGRVPASYGFDALSPFDRSPENGFRGVRNSSPLPAEVTAPRVLYRRDFSLVKPASDEVFRVYRSLYTYSKLPLNARIESEEDSKDWKKQKITLDAAYGAERLPIYLFLPKNTHPPYQTVVFFPSARVYGIPSSANLGDLDFIDYVIRSGRAVVYPVYKGTYERSVPGSAMPDTSRDRDRHIQWSKDLGRSIDYLETRQDIDATKLGYLGVSAGTAFGVILAALEDRFKAVVFLDGGYFQTETPLQGSDQADFAPRLKAPVLMVNGRYDATFPPETSQIPLYRMLGTPEADKRHVVLETPHDVRQQRPTLTKEVLSWLDKYLGKVD